MERFVNHAIAGVMETTVRFVGPAWTVTIAQWLTRLQGRACVKAALVATWFAKEGTRQSEYLAFWLQEEQHLLLTGNHPVKTDKHPLRQKQEV